MVDRRVMEKDAAALTGLRIKAARVLTNLNQEGFAEKFKFGYASVKNWELGRSIPREDTVHKMLDAFYECGVKTTRDWLLFGLGSGPNHIGEHEDNLLENLTSAKPEVMGFSTEVAQFERSCVKNNIRPLVASVSDNLMAPYFFKDDVVGAESIELKSLGLKPQISIEYPYLVEITPSNFQPRFLARDARGAIKFWRSHKEDIVGEIKHMWLGRIIWFRRPSIS
jgi:transcriptional regulator with XRE-family HTH domain